MGRPNQSAAFLWGFNPAYSAVNVKTTGARGDGIADDTAAIQAAIDRASEGSGQLASGLSGTAYLPKGRYRITAPLVLRVGQGLVGAGARASVIVYEGPGAAIQVGDGNPTPAPTFNHWITVQDLELAGLEADTQGQWGGEIGIQLGTRPPGTQITGQGFFQNLHIRNFRRGIYSAFTAEPLFQRIRVSHCEDAVYLPADDFQSNNLIKFNDCGFYFNHRRGVRALQGDTVTFRSCRFEQNGEEGAFISSAEDMSVGPYAFDNCYFEGNNRLRVDSGEAQLAILGGAFPNPIIRDADIRSCRFSNPHANNRHVLLDRVQATLWHPQFSGTSIPSVGILGNATYVDAYTTAPVATHFEIAGGGSARALVQRLWPGDSDGWEMWQNVSGSLAKVLEQIGPNGEIAGNFVSLGRLDAAGEVRANTSMGAIGTIRIGDRLIRVASGDPNGNHSAPVGSLFLSTNGSTGTTLWVKESGVGNTGWVAK